MVPSQSDAGGPAAWVDSEGQPAGLPYLGDVRFVQDDAPDTAFVLEFGFALRHQLLRSPRVAGGLVLQLHL